MKKDFRPGPEIAPYCLSESPRRVVSESRRPSKLRPRVSGRECTLWGDLEWNQFAEYRQIQPDVSGCRYYPLDSDPKSTEVHLWTFEHKSAKPLRKTGPWNDSGVGRDAESGHGNGKRANRDCDIVGDASDGTGRGQGSRARAARDGGSAGLQHGGIEPVRPGRVGAADRGDQGRTRASDLPAGRLRGPTELEPAGDQRRRQQVLLRRRGQRQRQSRRRASASIRSASWSTG